MGKNGCWNTPRIRTEIHTTTVTHSQAATEGSDRKGLIPGGLWHPRRTTPTQRSRALVLKRLLPIEIISLCCYHGNIQSESRDTLHFPLLFHRALSHSKYVYFSIVSLLINKPTLIKTPTMGYYSVGKKRF